MALRPDLSCRPANPSPNAAGFIDVTSMRSQLATASKRTLRLLPYAFTKQQRSRGTGQHNRGMMIWRKTSSALDLTEVRQLLLLVTL
jgi:hypothetical protein